MALTPAEVSKAAPEAQPYSRSDMTSHGFRATAATLLNECGLWHPDAIERLLAHGEKNGVRTAYIVAHTGQSASRWRSGGPTIWMNCVRAGKSGAWISLPGGVSGWRATMRARAS